MSETVERTSLNLRYQTHRLRDNAHETRLLASIVERGIEQPLEGVDTSQGRFLLNGFKRYRCATKLGMECLPYVCLGDEEAEGIASLMQVGKDKPLSILEQARFVVELLTMHGMSVADVAEILSRSKAWVSMRRGLLDEMSATVQEILFRGALVSDNKAAPGLRRMGTNGVTSQEIERFMQAVAGTHLSVREIEMLAQGYFRGPAALREEIDQGNWKWSLEQMQAVGDDPKGCSDFELALLRDLERLLKSIGRVMAHCDDQRLQTRAFHAQANLLVARLLSGQESFFKKMDKAYNGTGAL